MNVPSGILFFVVGRSGSGKDTLMRKTAEILKSEQIPITVVQRVITRPSDESENSFSVSESEFLRKKDNDEFAISWFIYNNWYGCPRDSIEVSLLKGDIVLLNVSRGVLHEARKKFPRSKIISIEVPIQIAHERLKSRHRENGSYLNDRLARMKEKIEMPSPDIIIKNDGDLTKAAYELSSHLKSHYFKNKKGEF
ncbi:MAG: phosphonate metabolism protein/1,5-bisphosphokinase (PRPP-forming) PhnN [Candidatus Hodarchaeota archaeon]